MILGLARSYCLACPKTRVTRTASIILSLRVRNPLRLLVYVDLVYLLVLSD